MHIQVKERLWAQTCEFWETPKWFKFCQRYHHFTTLLHAQWGQNVFPTFSFHQADKKDSQEKEREREKKWLPLRSAQPAILPACCEATKGAGVGGGGRGGGGGEEKWKSDLSGPE